MNRDAPRTEEEDHAPSGIYAALGCADLADRQCELHACDYERGRAMRVRATYVCTRVIEEDVEAAGFTEPARLRSNVPGEGRRREGGRGGGGVR